MGVRELHHTLLRILDFICSCFIVIFLFENLASIQITGLYALVIYECNSGEESLSYECDLYRNYWKTLAETLLLTAEPFLVLRDYYIQYDPPVDPLWLLWEYHHIILLQIEDCHYTIDAIKVIKGLTQKM